MRTKKGMRFIKVSIILLLVAMLVAPADAQINRRRVKKNNRAMAKYRGKKNRFTKQKRYSYLAFSVNANNYLGDIAPKAKWGSTKLAFTRPGFSATYGYRFGPRYSLRGSLSWGRLQSDDFEVADPNGENSKFRYVRNAHFRNDIWELSAVAVFDLFKNEGSYLSRVNITPYALIGAAVFHHNPKARVPDSYVLPANPAEQYDFPDAGKWVALRPLGTEGQYSDLQPTDANYGIKPYSLWQFAIPVGIGARYRLADALDISFDISVRWLFTDYIDDVSRNYVDLGVLNSDLARAMSDRSRLPTSAKGEPRDISGWSTYTYTGRDGKQYEVINGYGHEFPTNYRGGRNVNDIYYVTSIRIAYIIGARFRRPKFR